MTRPRLRSAAAVLMLGTAACFHQVVNTGRAPGSTVVERPWTATWIFGLVPANDIDIMRQCPGGVAMVETQESFLNGLVGAITLGIYTPVDVKVTCAAAGSASAGALEVHVAAGATDEEAQRQIGAALERAASQHEALVVRF